MKSYQFRKKLSIGQVAKFEGMGDWEKLNLQLNMS